MVIEVFDDNGRSTDAVMGRAVLSIPPPDGEWGEMELQLEPQGTIHLNVTCIDEASERRRLNAQNNRTYAMLRAAIEEGLRQKRAGDQFHGELHRAACTGVGQPRWQMA